MGATLRPVYQGFFPHLKFDFKRAASPVEERERALAGPGILRRVQPVQLFND